jgi:hypothetical protein
MDDLELIATDTAKSWFVAFSDIYPPSTPPVEKMPVPL